MKSFSKYLKLSLLLSFLLSAINCSQDNAKKDIPTNEVSPPKQATFNTQTPSPNKRAAIAISDQYAAKAAEEKFGHIKKAGEEFLAKNKSAKGVKTTASGLQYIVMKEGKGANVLPTNRIKIHYHGTTIDGKVFDSTVLNWRYIADI